MKNPNIKTRSAYTFFNSLLKISDILDLSVKNGYSNAFLIDRNIMYGAMEFYFLCIKLNVKPIIGLEIQYNNINKILIAKNFNGYKKLIDISSDIQLKNEIDISSKDLISFEETLSPVLYKNKEDIKILQDFYSIKNIEKFIETSSHFLSREEFKNINSLELLSLIDELIDEVDLIIPEKKNILPTFLLNQEKVNPEIFLEKLLKEKLMNLLNKNKFLDRNKYIRRTSYELGVISKMGFASYFLIVMDIVNWAKSNDIFVGPGRGSAPGSIVSFLLNITTIDPIKNNLLFERFLNIERISMPDIDIDFDDTRRDEVIKYITFKYGENNVAQIITFQTLRAKMSFKDIARINGMSATETNEITKLIPDDMNLEKAYNSSKIFKTKIESSLLIKKIFSSAKLIEGLPRQYSTHAAGIVLSDNPIRNSVPVQKGYSGILQTQYSMDYMEYSGLLKIDILGLRNLSFIKEIINEIDKNHNKKIDFNNFTFNDKKIFKMFSSGKTSGIFQFESPGMRASLKEIGVDSFEDIVAAMSLFRPGPMKMITEFAKRKNGISKIKYINNDIKEILKGTYGIIIYQEQIMKMAQVLSGFSLSKSDILRRAIGKKDNLLLLSLKDDFFNGAAKKGFSKEEIKKNYDLIYEFSNYGFNRSHAYAYTTISYWLAWLKIYYPLEFMNSLLNSVIGNVNKTSSYILECQDMNINIEEPSIFYSKSNYVIVEKNIFMGFRSIKKIGESVINKILIVQNNIDSNTNLIDLFIEMVKNGITESIIEILVKANCFRDFNINKESILKSISRIYEYIEIIKIDDGGIVSFDKNIIPDLKIIFLKEKNEK